MGLGRESSSSSSTRCGRESSLSESKSEVESSKIISPSISRKPTQISAGGEILWEDDPESRITTLI
jgi:hypothetical protein